MNKAVLVMDMPNKCSECPICASWQASAFSIREYWCPASGNKDVDPKGKPNWCPLSALPVKFENADPYERDLNSAYDCGWNDCINVITGE